MTAARVVKYVFEGQITGLQSSMKAASASVGKLADDMTKADAKGAKFRQGLTTSGDAAGKFGLAAAAGLGAIIAVSSKFDAKMSEVQAATGETAANMDKLRDAAIDAGAKTAFSASEAAQGIEELAKAGVSTADILGGGLAGALDLAAAGQIEVGEAAEYAAKAMTMFGLEGSDVGHVADLLSAAAGKAVGEVGDFGQALNQVGLVASQTGLSIEDTVGTLAAFAQAGLQGSDSGTAFRSMLQRLQNPLGQGAKAMESLGINAYDAQGNFVGITDIAGQLQEKLGGLTQAQRDAAMAQIFGSDAVRAATVLYNEGAEGIEGWIDQTNDAGYAAETAATKLDNLRGDFEALTGSVETLLITSGEGSEGFFRSLVQGATDGVNAVNEMPPALKNTATAMLGITAVTGGALWFGSRAIQAVANTREALRQLGVQSINTRGMLLKGAAGMAGLAVANSELAESTGVSNTAAYALMGTMAGPWGAAIGGAVGATMDLAAANDDLEAAIEGAQEALASMDIAVLERHITTIKREMAEFSLRGLFGAGPDPAALEAIREMEVAINDLLHPDARTGSGWGDIFGHEMGTTAAAFDLATGSAEDFALALEDINGVLEGRASMRDYQAALDDFTQGLKDNGKAHGIATEKGRANNENLDKIAITALKVAENLEGMDRVRVLSRARGDFLAAAKDLEIPRKRALELADSLGLLDRKSAKPTIGEKGAKETEGKIDKVQRKADKLDKSRPNPLLLLTDKATPKVNAFEEIFGRVDRSHAKPTVSVETGAAHAALARLQQHVNGLSGKTITVHAQTGAIGHLAAGGHVSGPGITSRQTYLKEQS